MGKITPKEKLGWIIGFLIFILAAWLIYYLVQPKEVLVQPSELPVPHEQTDGQ